jgi:hypothetical protein
MGNSPLLILSLHVCILTILAPSAVAEDTKGDLYDKLRDPERIWVLDCSAIHNVGNLHMNVTNWGCFGSYPNSNQPTAECPSAQWPANSGVEHLWIAGLWVGARKAGIPVVSTAAFEREFMPPGTEDPLARIYESYEGIFGGARLPAPPDDDNDGVSDEDWRNGVDDDGDGEVDEDFAAISQQMFTCWFTDDHPQSVVINPEHTPLHLFVRQESYQWEDEQFYDFVGVEYTILNYGQDIIEDLYIGFFADGDVGLRTDEDYAQDDCTGLWQGFRCARRGDILVPVYISVAYFYDCDGDNGLAPGYFGILFLGHDTDPLGDEAPDSVGITSYQNFSGDLPFVNGGDPSNDFERYDLMSRTTFDRNAEVPRDYRMLMATGPFRELLPDSQMVLQVAFVCGYGLEGMLDAAANAAIVFEGNWFNIDGNPMTGVDGRETPVYGPVSELDPDTCDTDLSLESASRGEIVWINADCARELDLFVNSARCGGSFDGTFEDFQTGTGGRETNVHWLVGTAPPPPAMRILPGDGRVTMLWDDFSETTPDPSTLEHDFEGYRIWRADGWHRPIGTSARTGPSRDLWQLLQERDIVNGIGADDDFRRPFSEGGWGYDPLVGMSNRGEFISYFEENLVYAPLDTVPCPTGLTRDECDTLESLARSNLGYEGGKQYYRFVDDDVHNGMHYFYSITAFDHVITGGVPVRLGKYGEPASNFQYVTAVSNAQKAEEFEDKEIYVVPNPATEQSMAPWKLEPNMDDPTGIKVEFRNLPACGSTVRIFTIAGDLVEVLYHDGTGGVGTLTWDLVSRNGQDITSGVYLFTVHPDDGGFSIATGKFVVIR